MKLNFPKENPPRKDFKLWEEALRSIVTAEGLLDRLGRYLHDNCKKWEWRLDETTNRLLHCTET